MRIVEYVDLNREGGYYPIAINAIIYAWLGDFDRAMALFEIAYDERDPLMTWLQTTPLPDELLMDARFQDLLGRMNS